MSTADGGLDRGLLGEENTMNIKYIERLLAREARIQQKALQHYAGRAEKSAFPEHCEEDRRSAAECSARLADLAEAWKILRQARG